MHVKARKRRLRYICAIIIPFVVALSSDLLVSRSSCPSFGEALRLIAVWKFSIELGREEGLFFFLRIC